MLSICIYLYFRKFSWGVVYFPTNIFKYLLKYNWQIKLYVCIHVCVCVWLFPSSLCCWCSVWEVTYMLGCCTCLVLYPFFACLYSCSLWASLPNCGAWTFIVSIAITGDCTLLWCLPITGCSPARNHSSVRTCRQQSCQNCT